MARRFRRRPRPGTRPRKTRDLSDWTPKTKLGRMVMQGEITTIGDALATGLPFREPEVVDILLPEMEDEVLDVNMVQRMTDSGRRVNFVITCVVGNQDGFVGLGRSRGREVGPAIRRAIDDAKIHIIQVKRGCGSWECGCYRSHSLPYKVVGKSGSVEVTLKPAPQGVGLAVGDVAKSVLRLGGLSDVWGAARGHTKTTVNYAVAAFEALKATARVKVRAEDAERLKIKAGAEQVFVRSVEAPAVESVEIELPEEIQVEGEPLTKDAPEEAKEKEEDS